jgi:serine/threonine protein kinase
MTQSTCDTPTAPAAGPGAGAGATSLPGAHTATPDGCSAGRLVAGRYRVDRLLGKGGMGSVWLATDEVLMRPVAIKEFTLPEHVMDDEAANASVLREARAASQVCHSGVVRVYDLAVEDGRQWIVMEALDGPTLAQVIREEKRLPVERVVDIALQLLEALEAVHREGIVHRDVKPSNVQVCGTSRVVLTDFGLASSDDVALVDEAGQFFGSPPYTAPEAVRGGAFRPASDLFSLGATLYAALEGHQPFGDLTHFSTLVAVLHQSPGPVVHAGRLAPLIDGLLTKDPERRWGLQQAYLWLKDVESDLVTAGAGRESLTVLAAG